MYYSGTFRLANPQSLGPEGVQISGLVKIMQIKCHQNIHELSLKRGVWINEVLD